jgi:hypothetical protein
MKTVSLNHGRREKSHIQVDPEKH